MGSRTATTALGRTRRGIVVGERQVYDAQPGNPPTLSNRQNVLLVAVSLHRRYRIFPGDARAITPPTPKQRRKVAQPASTPTNPPPRSYGPIRNTTLTASDLEELVADEIKRRLERGREFYSCNVAHVIRQQQPGVTLQHDDVRSLVDAQMAAALASGQYTITENHCPVNQNCACYMPTDEASV